MLQQHFTDSYDPIGILVTIEFMNARDITRLGTCSKEFYNMVALNPSSWNHIKLSNTNLYEHKLPKTSVARSAVTTLFLNPELIPYSIHFMADFNRLENILVEDDNRVESTKLSKPINNYSLPKFTGYFYLHNDLPRLIKLLLDHVPKSTCLLDLQLDSELPISSITLPENIHTLSCDELNVFTHSPFIKKIQLCGNFNEPDFYQFPNLESITCYTENISMCHTPNSLHTYISYSHYGSGFPWSQEASNSLRQTRFVVSAEDKEIDNFLSNKLGEAFFPNLETLQIILETWYESMTLCSIANSVTKNILKYKSSNFPKLTQLSVFWIYDTYIHEEGSSYTQNGVNVVNHSIKYINMLPDL